VNVYVIGVHDRMNDYYGYLSGSRILIRDQDGLRVACQTRIAAGL
jgi:hypothetical protein